MVWNDFSGSQKNLDSYEGCVDFFESLCILKATLSEICCNYGCEAIIGTNKLHFASAKIPFLSMMEKSNEA